MARALGGTGTYTKLAYVSAAYQCPMLVATLVLGAIPFLNCAVPVLAIYGVALNTKTVMAVHRLDFARALAVSLTLPGVVTALVAAGILINGLATA
jgi:hypothetical protein